MKNKIIIFILLFLSVAVANAQELTRPDEFDKAYFKLMGFVIVGLLVLASLLIVILLNAVKKLGQPQSEEISENIQRNAWDRFWAFKDAKPEKDLMLDESYDGIVELDNPTPPWFNFLFYSTIAVAIVYLIWYHGTQSGKLQDDEYKQELVEAAAMKQEYLKKAGNLVDESNVTALTDAKAIDEGRATFIQKCAVCHGEKGEGKVGPNLTDEYWLHGGSIQDIFKTIKYGVQAKGMIPWEKQLSGLQIQQVSSFIQTLKGTNPAGAKAPEGELYGAPDSTLSTAPKDTMATAMN